jgi:hypothetical protein
MMRPANLQEFGELLYAQGKGQEADFGAEICDMIANDMGEEYADLCNDLDDCLPKESLFIGKPAKAIEWLGDRVNLLVELEDTLEKNGYEGDADDALDRLISDLSELDAAKKILTDSKHWHGGDFQDALAKLCERLPVEYDL